MLYLAFDLIIVMIKQEFKQMIVLESIITKIFYNIVEMGDMIIIIHKSSK